MKTDNKKSAVLKALQICGFEIVKESEHIKLRNGSGASVSVPNHKRIKGSTLLDVCRQGGIDKKTFFSLI